MLSYGKLYLIIFRNEKQIRHTPRKADPRKRVKGQSLKAEGYESDSVNATPSY